MTKAKNIFLLLTLITITLNSFAQPDSVLKFIQKANDFYKHNLYDSALIYYTKVLNAGWVAPELYYNIGNTYFRKGDLAKAILFYERAYRLDPNNEKIKHNLEFAQQFIQDKFESNEFFIKRWWQNLALSLKADLWAWISIVLFAITLILGFWFLFSKTIAVRKLSFFLGIFTLLLSVLTFSLSLENKHLVLNSNEAIILQPTSVRSSPSIQGTELYLIHQGIKVKILSSNDGWYEIKLPNGSIGWIPKQNAEKI